MVGYVSKISNLKHSKSESKTEYFNMTIQTERGIVRAVCFLPDKWKYLYHFQQDNRSCVIGNVVESKPTEVKLINHSTVKANTLMFLVAYKLGVMGILSLKIQPINRSILHVPQFTLLLKINQKMQLHKLHKYANRQQ